MYVIEIFKFLQVLEKSSSKGCSLFLIEIELYDPQQYLSINFKRKMS